MSAALYGARALARWVRAGGRPQHAGRLHALALWWQARWFEQNWHTQAQRLATLQLPQDPALIVGLWRSGTTALHELLSTCTGWVTPQTWQCFAPSTCFLTGAPTEQAITERPMDRGQIATLGPQEDEFALLLLGEPSIYRGFIDPRRLLECARHEWSASAQPATALPRWRQFVAGIAAQSPHTRLLLKSPNHSFRLPLMRAAFPRAKFIWMGRPAGELLASNMKMWGAMMSRYALWECPGGLLEQFLQEVLQACAQVLQRCLDEMPREQLLWIEFEQLQREPRATLRQVLDFLGFSASMDAARLTLCLDAAIARVPIHPGSRAPLPQAAHVREFERLAAAARHRFGRGCAPQLG